MAPILTEVQKTNFEKRLGELGMTKADVAPEAKPGVPLKPKMIKIQTLDEFKRLFGNPDNDYDSGKMKHHHETLPPYDKNKIHMVSKDMAGDDRKNIDKALKGYVLGDSKQYDTYKPAIEKMHFPMEVAAYAADDLTIYSDETFQAPTGTHNYGTITIYKDGTLKFSGDSNVDAQQMTYIDQRMLRP